MTLRAILLLYAPLAMAQVQLQFAHSASRGPFQFTSVVQLSSGDSVMIGSAPAITFQNSNPTSKITLAAIGPAAFQNGEPTDVLPVLGGSSNDVPAAAAVDPSGNIWIAGSTNSDDFNLVNPIIGQKVAYRTAGFVMELDPTGTQLLFSTYLAGQKPSPPGCQVCTAQTVATSIAIDSAGNVYVGGITNEPDFPTTPGAYMTAANALSDGVLVVVSDALVLKISPAGKLIFSTSLGTGNASCESSSCLGFVNFASPASLAVNASGVLTVALSETGSPAESIGTLSTDASRFILLPALSTPGSIGQTVIAEDSSGNLDVFGSYTIYSPTGDTFGLYAAKIAPNGSVIYLTDLGNTSKATDVSMAGIVLDASGNAYLAGTSSSPQFSTMAGVPKIGPGFVLRLNSTGTEAQTLFRFPAGVVFVPPAITPNGDLMLANGTGWLLTIDPAYDFTSPAIVAAANSASLMPLPGILPGQLITLFGFDLSTPMQVEIRGFAATVLYAGPNQINLQVPFEITSTSIQAYGTTINAPSGPSLGLFTTDGVHATAVNQDGTVNSASNPAAPDSVISLYGTGAIWPSGLTDGAAATAALPLNQDANAFQVFGDGVPLSIFYEGAAPDLIYGVFQLNVQLTGDMNPTLTLQAPSGLAASPVQTSNSVGIYVK